VPGHGVAGFDLQLMHADFRRLTEKTVGDRAQGVSRHAAGRCIHQGHVYGAFLVELFTEAGGDMGLNGGGRDDVEHHLVIGDGDLAMAQASAQGKARVVLPLNAELEDGHVIPAKTRACIITQKAAANGGIE